MDNYITIDGGTTNTRICLVKDGILTDIVKIAIGAKTGIDDGQALSSLVRNGICCILEDNNMQESDISRIIASGMITSEFGLYEVKHTVLPAGIKELHDTAVEIKLADISDIPFVFLRGVKSVTDKLETTDMMRGEETELIGMGGSTDGIYVLPGSHTKIIKVEDGRIASFSTALTGEMIAALSENTILKDAVALDSRIDENYLLEGVNYCEKNGLNEALFKVRVLKNVFSCNNAQIYSFFVGAVLSADAARIAEFKTNRVVIGGKAELASAYRIILEERYSIRAVSVPDKTNAAALGAVKIYEYDGE